MEACCICFDNNYHQNNVLVCGHPLCHQCYNKLQRKCCPICRSFKRVQVLVIDLKTTKNMYVPINKIFQFCLYSYEWTQYMKKFLINRLKNETVLKVNRYRKYDKFILVKKQYKPISELINNDFIELFINKTFSFTNTKIIQQEILHRFSKLGSHQV